MERRAERARRGPGFANQLPALPVQLKDAKQEARLGKDYAENPFDEFDYNVYGRFMPA